MSIVCVCTCGGDSVLEKAMQHVYSVCVCVCVGGGGGGSVLEKAMQHVYSVCVYVWGGGSVLEKAMQHVYSSTTCTLECDMWSSIWLSIDLTILATMMGCNHVTWPPSCDVIPPLPPPPHAGSYETTSHWKQA